MIRIQHEDFSVEEEIARLTAHNTVIGGVVSFVGMVRDYVSDLRVTAMELEHYPGMTESELEQIEAAARAQFAVEEILVVHRVGRLDVGEKIVLVVATSRHRAAAFDACRYVIDYLKVRATFWKKEITEQGAQWVDACPGCEAAASQWMELKQATPHTHTHANPAGHHGLCHANPEAPAAPDHGRSHDHDHDHGHDHGHGHNHAITPNSPSWNGLQVAILTLSDSRTRAEDKSGDALEGLVRAVGGTVARRTVIPDDRPRIREQLVAWADSDSMDVILTTGGTGPGPRDITPEATRDVCAKEMPGVAELMRQRGLEQTRTAVLSRGVVALRGKTLVINLPGSQRGATHGFETIADLAPHILRMVHGGGH